MDNTLVGVVVQLAIVKSDDDFGVTAIRRLVNGSIDLQV